MFHTITLAVCILLSATLASAQSKTTELLSKKYSETRSFFFYNNTLRMLNQEENKEFDELIKDIEKMKLLMINRKENKIEGTQLKKLSADYKSEAYEQMMVARHSGKNVEVMLKEKNGKTIGTVFLMTDDEYVYVLDILGSVALNKVSSFLNTLEKSTDLNKKIDSFKSAFEDDKEKKE